MLPACMLADRAVLKDAASLNSCQKRAFADIWGRDFMGSSADTCKEKRHELLCHELVGCKTECSWHICAVRRSVAWVSPPLCLALPARTRCNCSFIQPHVAALVIQNQMMPQRHQPSPVLAKPSWFLACNMCSE